MANAPVFPVDNRSLNYAMPFVPRVGNAPGLVVTCTTTDTDYPQAIPANARGATVWFETSAAVHTLVTGRVGCDAQATPQTPTAVAPLTNSDALLGYVPAVGPLSFNLPVDVNVIHLASVTAGAVAYVTWGFE